MNHSQNHSNFWRDFKGGYNTGYSIFHQSTRLFHQGIKGIKKIQRLAETVGDIPLIDDAIKFVFDNPFYEEAIAQFDIIDDISQDIDTTIKDINDAIQTGSVHKRKNVRFKNEVTNYVPMPTTNVNTSFEKSNISLPNPAKNFQSGFKVAPGNSLQNVSQLTNSSVS